MVLEVLTPREREILRLVAQGSSGKEIAAALNIVEGTVKNHLHNVLESSICATAPRPRPAPYGTGC